MIDELEVDNDKDTNMFNSVDRLSHSKILFTCQIHAIKLNYPDKKTIKNFSASSKLTKYDGDTFPCARVDKETRTDINSIIEAAPHCTLSGIKLP